MSTEQEKGKAVPLLKINNTTISVNKIVKVLLDGNSNQVSIQLENLSAPFVFSEDASEKSTSLFVAIGELLRKTQTTVPFLFFGNAAVRFDLLNYISLDGRVLAISTGVNEPDFFSFESNEKAQNVFDELMFNLGIGFEPTATKSPLSEKPQKKNTKYNKPPDKPPRKARRV